MIPNRLGDLKAAEEHLLLTLHIHGLDRRRTRAIVTAHLAGVRPRQGDTDGALTTWADFLDCAEGVRSIEIRSALQDMSVRLLRLPDNPTAQELRNRAAAFA
ncbi:hypothetical protein [Streptomyces sp. NPDC058683]|uniref:hypothetical protein n=1 Tax=Streptomyces sp. NPDC058683 TaxID=3346597 RepID=UPI003656F957